VALRSYLWEIFGYRVRVSCALGARGLWVGRACEGRIVDSFVQQVGCKMRRGFNEGILVS